MIYDMQDGMGGISELMMRWAKEEMREGPVLAVFFICEMITKRGF